MTHSSRIRIVGGLSACTLLLVLFWFAAKRAGILTGSRWQIATTFASFAILFGVYFAFGLGFAEWCRARLRRLTVRLMAPALLALPYVLYAFPRHEVLLRFFLLFATLPVGIAALMNWQRRRERRNDSPAAFSFVDFIVLLTVAVLISQRLLAEAFPHPGLASLPKLLLLGSVLYGYLVVRELEGIGFDWRLQPLDLAVGAREYVFYFPFAVVIGTATQFIAFHADIRQPMAAFPLLLSTFFFVAVPEELFFRGILQNLLQRRLGTRGALAITAVVFGLSHFNKMGMSFNWRYVLLAAIAGVFYGRAWQHRNRIVTSAITHTAVDVTWSLWFR
jgi:membrane protease YdiL (CAAX protease family)